MDALVRSVAVNGAASHSLFLGAGASISSEVPSAASCIWEWKQRIVLTNLPPDLAPHYREISLERVRRGIQAWLDQRGEYPPEGAPEEYGFYAERCLPLSDDRTRYFQRLVEGACPGPGYRFLPLLARAGIVGAVWTTNFDLLALRAAVAAGLTVVEASPESAERLRHPLAPGRFLHVALHGDFRYDALKNTPEELRQQNEVLETALAERLRGDTVIVVGYSGRDLSVMRALARGYREPGSGRLFWCGYGDEQPAPNVEKLIRFAHERGREAFFVRASGFDDLMIRLATHCLGEEHQAVARAIAAEGAAGRDASPPAFRVDHPYASGVLKSNAFPVRCPSEVLQITDPRFAVAGAWDALREHTRESGVVAVPRSGKVLALGLVDDVRRLFGGSDCSGIARVPVDGRDLGRDDGAVVNLLTRGLVRAIAGARDLGTDGEQLLWVNGRGVPHRMAGGLWYVQQAAAIGLRRIGGRDYMLIMPTIRVTDARGDVAPEAVEKEVKRQILTRQYNDKYNEALRAWGERILPKRSDAEFAFPHGQASTFRYAVGRVPAFAKLLTAKDRSEASISAKVERQVRHVGTQFCEPTLVFASRRGAEEVRDPHPIRGLVENRPYDFALTARGLSTEVRVGVVCPRGDATQLRMYLDRLRRTVEPDSKQEYLLTYPGFETAFGVTLDLPDPRTGAWFGVNEPALGTAVREGARQLRQEIQRAIDALHGAFKPTVTLIYVPARWQPWEAYELEGESFDLHDFSKAYCVQKGVATQFLREATLAKRHQGEVTWWLGLSLYVKAMRTPWTLDGQDKDTAFVGLGFGLDPSAGPGRHVLIGCSHIYNAAGLGLAFRLNQLEEGWMRRGNPFMSREDARRMGEMTRQLFWDDHHRLPSRVVLHKKTPFTREEREGLLVGLHGVEHVDMLEINRDPMLRYLASRRAGAGGFREDGYPVRRGTVVVIEGNRALLWVHGAADPVRPGGRPYYQGKSRIPAPLVIKRHSGSTPLDVIAPEILGLSKMNWNSFDLYGKLPATIESSNRIAKIGSLLGPGRPAGYDYRLFI